MQIIPVSDALSRADARKLKRAVQENEAVVEADRRFFRRFPHRIFRVRRMAAAEGVQLRITSGQPLRVMEPGTAAFTVVKQLLPGVRMRIHVTGPGDEDGSTAGDDIGAWLWDRYAEQDPGIRHREAAMRAIFEKAAPGGRQ